MKTISRSILLITTLSIPAFLTSCGAFFEDRNQEIGALYLNDYQATKIKTSYARVGYWDAEGVEGEPLIRINIDQQMAYFYRKDLLVGKTPISSGIEGRITPTGRFEVTQKDEDHASSLYGHIEDDVTGKVIVEDAKTGRDKAKKGQTFVHAPMTHFLRFNKAIGMHKGHLPGYAASHGCIRLPGHMAKLFYENAELGTTVIVEE